MSSRWGPVLLLLLAASCRGEVAGGRADGPAVYAEACARCHGDHGRPTASMASQLGVRDLTSPEFRDRASLELVENQVRHGSSNKVMPSFTGALSDAQIRAVAEYVLTLSQP